MKPRLIIFCAALFLLPCLAQAQVKQTFTLRDGKLMNAQKPSEASGSSHQPVVIDGDQQLIFKAQASLVSGDYAQAEALYTQAINLDGSNIEAYLQRAAVRRELGDAKGVDSDGRRALALVNGALQAEPREAGLYYKRSMALRFLRQFDAARNDVLTAINLGGKPSLRNDLQAIELERKMAASHLQ